MVFGKKLLGVMEVKITKLRKRDHNNRADTRQYNRPEEITFP